MPNLVHINRIFPVKQGDPPSDHHLGDGDLQ